MQLCKYTILFAFCYPRPSGLLQYFAAISNAAMSIINSYTSLQVHACHPFICRNENTRS